MAYPFFYAEDISPASKQVELDADTSRHIVQVLRMQEGDRLHLTDGKGTRFTTEVATANKKACVVKVMDAQSLPAPRPRLMLGISVLKNTSRLEWLLEKITEIGITEIVPLLCERTEKERFRTDRMRSICVSAMLQSQQCWLPLLHEPISFDLLLKQEEIASVDKFIAHCEPSEKQLFKTALTDKSDNDKLLLIGPEGDFSGSEIELAIRCGCKPVSLGQTRLRTETAGLVGVTLMRFG